MLQPLISPLREDGIRALNNNEIISAERFSYSSATLVFVFVFAQSGNGLGKAIKQNTSTIFLKRFQP